MHARLTMRLALVRSCRLIHTPVRIYRIDSVSRLYFVLVSIPADMESGPSWRPQG